MDSDSGKSEGSTPDKQKLRNAAPYEGVLLRAFDKLTSEVFVFLLAYLILVIGFAVFSPGLVTPLRTLIYILPILGIAGYLWIKSGRVTKRAEDSGVQVWSGVATGSARVTGVRGGIGSLLGRVKVRSGFAGGDARVVGVDVGSEAEGRGAQEEYLLELFRKLNASDRLKLVSEASRILVDRS